MSLRVIIVEDEGATARDVQRMLMRIRPDVSIDRVLTSVEQARIHFRGAEHEADLLLMDIQLGDGRSLDVLPFITPPVPIIFITAHDEYMLQAFTGDGIAYILKPVSPEDLATALDKYDRLLLHQGRGTDRMKPASMPKAFLAHHRGQLVPLSIDRMAWIRSEHEVTRVHAVDGTRLVLDETLERLERMLPADRFFRLNRQYVVSRASIKALEPHFNGRMVVKLMPEAPEQVYVSKDKAPLLKRWILSGERG